MTRDQLEHAIRAACDVSLGELSPFHRAFGFYVHGVSIDSALLPEGWETRTVRVSHPMGTRGHRGRCLECHDLAASKLAAYRYRWSCDRSWRHGLRGR